MQERMSYECEENGKGRSSGLIQLKLAVDLITTRLSNFRDIPSQITFYIDPSCGAIERGRERGRDLNF